MNGIFGNQNTLTDFDTIQLTGTNNTLNASVDGHTNINGVTIQGVQTWNLVDDGFGTVTINGGGTAASPSITGLTELNFNGNGGGGTLNLGTALLPIDKPGDLANGFTLGVSNALGGIGHHIDIAFASGVLTGTETITVNAFSVGNVDNNDLNDAYGIAAGGTGPKAKGFGTWVLNSTGATLGSVNDIALGGEGTTSATTLKITDDGSTTIVYASSASGSTAVDWSNLQVIDGTGTSGHLTITGAETFADANGAGLLSANSAALTTVLGGSGGLFADLTSLSAATADAMTAVNGGTGLGEVAFNNGVLTTNLPVALFNIDVLDDASNTQGGTINMANFPLVAGTANSFGFPELQFFDAHGGTGDALGSDLTIANGLTDFNVATNNMGMGGHNITISAGLANLNGGDTELALGLSNNGTLATLTINDYKTVDLVASATGTDTITNLVDNQVPGVLDAVVNISGAAKVHLGNTATEVEGTATVQINGLGNTAIHDTGSGILDLGITNAHTLTYNNALGQLFMEAPGTDTSGDFTVQVLAESNGGSLVQGSLGAVTQIGPNFNGHFNFSGAAGDDSLTAGPGGDAVFGAGGADAITITGHGGAGNEVFFGEYANSNTAHATFTGVNPDGLSNFAGTGIVIQEITNGGSAYEGFWGVQNGANGNPTSITGMFGAATGGVEGSMSTITGFQASGVNFDSLAFAADAWNGGNGGSGGLFFLDGATAIHSGTAVTGIVVPNGVAPQITAADNFLFDAGVGTIVNVQSASMLANDLHTIAPITLAGPGVAAGAQAHILVAYSANGGVNIADVDLVNTTGAALTSTNNAGFHIYASDMVHIAGITLGQLSDANIHFV
jgi:hypothetical protein